jgi:hypothetical protein
MNVNFIWTNGEFKYQYYLSVLTAIRTQNANVVLWKYPSNHSWYLKLLKKHGLIIKAITKMNFTAFQSIIEPMQGAIIKDYWMWYLGYRYGGIFMDLDTISLKDMTGLLGDRDMVVQQDIEGELDCEHPFNNAICIMKAKSKIVQSLFDKAVVALGDPFMKWGDTGPALMTDIIKNNRDKVRIMPFRELGGYGGHECQEIYRINGMMPVDVYAIHFFAYASGDMFENITPRYISDYLKVPYAKYIRETLQPEEWRVFDVKDWLFTRGRHYKPMYDYLTTHHCKNILEIGTFDGSNAIGMINTSLSPTVNYYGFDLFQEHTKELEELEVSTGYSKPPRSTAVLSMIMLSVGDHDKVHLTEGDSKVTLPLAIETLPIMDFIYIDGGHSIETIRSDWKYAQRLITKNTVVFFDDYFVGRGDVGCKFIERELGHGYSCEVVGDLDKYEVFEARLLKVKRRTNKPFQKSYLRFHLLGLAHVPTTKDIYSCAYTQKIVNLSKMLTDMGHEVILYCGEGSNTLATEQVQVLSDAKRKEVYGDYDWKTTFFKHDPTDAAHEEFNKNATMEINKRKHKNDILLCPMGNYQQKISEGTQLMTVESGIGYTGTFAKYKVYESYAWMHYVYGKYGVEDGNWYDCVIPNSYDPADFPFDPATKKYNYFVFIGRLIQRKGLQVAIEATDRLGVPLIVAGQGNLKDVEGRDFSMYSHVKHIGSIDPATRAKLISEAKGVFVPTYYIGPFEGVAVEAQMLGTPVLTTDWGVFAETVIHGKTGFRCRTLDEFVWAARHIGELNTQDCRDWAIDNYSINRVKFMYDEYLRRVYDLNFEGWYREHPERTNLLWLNRRYV